MARILTIDPDQTKGLRKLMVRILKRQNDGIVPGIFKVLMTDFQVTIPTGWLYGYLNERKGLATEQVATRDARDSG